MFVLYALVIGIVLGYIIGGRLKNMLNNPLHWTGLAISAFGIQFFLFTDKFASLFPPASVVPLHVLSYILILIFLFKNIKYLGIKIAGLGIISNFIAIVSNGGYMPTFDNNLALTSMGSNAEIIKSQGTLHNSSIISQHTNFEWLSDIFVLPSWLPLSNVFSIGDVLIGVGLCLYLILAMKSQNKCN